jgi:hypothetical protein
MNSFSKNLFVDAPKGAKHINANLKDPNSNDEIEIIPVFDIPGVDGRSYYSGFTIRLLFEKQWIEHYPCTNMLQGRLLSESSILLKFPKAVTSYSSYNPDDYDQFNKGLPAYLQTGLDNIRHAYVEEAKSTNMQSEFRYIVVDFSGHAEATEIELSSKVIFDEAGNDEELQLVTQKQSGDNYWAYWTVARTDVAAIKKGKLFENGVEKKSFV